MRPILRFWVGKCRYQDHKEFYLGTVQAESEMEALHKLFGLWSEVSPHPFPDHVVAVPGMVIFHPEQKEETV